jgi:hypothetical protein
MSLLYTFLPAHAAELGTLPSDNTTTIWQPLLRHRLPPPIQEEGSTCHPSITCIHNRPRKERLQQSVCSFFIYSSIDMLNKMYTIEMTNPFITRFKIRQETLWGLQIKCAKETTSLMHNTYTGSWFVSKEIPYKYIIVNRALLPCPLLELKNI